MKKLKIEKASEMGLCFGVKRAISILEKVARERGKVETLGPVVHNQQVVDELDQLGIRTAKNMDELQGNIIAITAHGVSPAVREEIRRRKLQVIDATCPTVRRAQTAAKTLAEAGFQVIIFGDPNHTEVQGILGWAGTNGIATLNSPEILKVDKLRRVGIISQTTQSSTDFASFVGELANLALERTKELRIINTICEATKKRQAAALALAGKVDLMIVIGGHNSANTRHLAKTCSACGVETHHIEMATELDKSWIQDRRYIGITAGASTLDRTVDEVVSILCELGTKYNISPEP
jgi:4-hydroxy-3-methylbut-2-enyl diphosphate reductase